MDKRKIWVRSILSVLLVLLLIPGAMSQATGPCDGANRWDGGATWNPDGSINDAPNSPAPNVLNLAASDPALIS